jgi:hypothetical protein
MIKELWFDSKRSIRFFSSGKCPDQLWFPPTLVFMDTRSTYPISLAAVLERGENFKFHVNIFSGEYSM